VREASRACCELIAGRSPRLANELRERLEDPLPPPREELRTVVELTTRMVLYAASESGEGRQAAARAAP
jgi:hypothetical protein